MRNILLAGAIAILAVPASLAAQTPGTPPADPMGSNTASATAPTPAPDSSMPSAPAPSTPDTTTPPPSAPDASSGMSTSAAPPPADAMNKTYPMCSKTVHDECRNRGGK